MRVMVRRGRVMCRHKMGQTLAATVPGRSAPYSVSGVLSRCLSRRSMCVSAVAILALGLRLLQLGTESLWIDEGYSIRYAREFNLAHGIRSIRPLYYAFLSLWMHIGHSEVILRLPSVISGVAATLVLYLVGKRLANTRVGAFAAALMAVSPFHVNHSQEIRMYSLLTLFTLVAMYLFILFVSTQKGRYLAGYIAFMLLSISTFPLAMILILVQNLALLLSKSRPLSRHWYVAQVLILSPCIPFVGAMIADTGSIAPEKWGGPSLLEVLEITGCFSLLSSGPPGSRSWWLLTVYSFLALALMAYGMSRVWKRGELRTWPTLLLLLWLTVPVFVTAELSRLTGAQWLPRYLIYSSPAYFLLLALSVSTLPGKRIQYVAMAALLLYPAWKLERYYERPMRPDWRQAVNYIQQHERPGDVIAIYRPGNGNVFEFYYHGTRPWLEVGGPKLQKKRPWTDARAATIVGSLPVRYHRVWLLMSQCDPSAIPVIEHFVRSRYEVIRRRSYAQVELIQFQRRRNAERERRYLERGNEAMVGPPGFEPGTNRL